MNGDDAKPCEVCGLFDGLHSEGPHRVHDLEKKVEVLMLALFGCCPKCAIPGVRLDRRFRLDGACELTCYEHGVIAEVPR